MTTIAITTPARPATYVDCRKLAPRENTSKILTWVTRAANFVIAVSEIDANARIERIAQDEVFLLVAKGNVSIESAAGRTEAQAESLSIIPPGPYSIRAVGRSRLVTVGTARETDLAILANNADQYQHQPADVAPLVNWPSPHTGFRLRHYVLSDYTRPDSNMRVFRSSTLMVNPLKKRLVPRDIHNLEPHAHMDFEQGSVVLEGQYFHHLRYPWTPDMGKWRDDEHIEIGAPSITIIPSGVVHTSRNIGSEPGWLMDVFGPPRDDFSLMRGMVCNEDEYPLPERLSTGR